MRKTTPKSKKPAKAAGGGVREPYPELGEPVVYTNANGEDCAGFTHSINQYAENGLPLLITLTVLDPAQVPAAIGFGGVPYSEEGGVGTWRYPEPEE